jgi:hypothetical protein
MAWNTGSDPIGDLLVFGWSILLSRPLTPFERVLAQAGEQVPQPDSEGDE